MYLMRIRSYTMFSIQVSDFQNDAKSQISSIVHRRFLQFSICLWISEKPAPADNLYFFNVGNIFKIVITVRLCLEKEISNRSEAYYHCSQILLETFVKSQLRIEEMQTRFAKSSSGAAAVEIASSQVLSAKPTGCRVPAHKISN